MRRSILPLLALMAGTALLPGQASVQVDWVSRYIWRGFDLLPGNHSAIQPSLNLDLGRSGLSFSIWGSFALEQRGTFKRSDEIDLALSYEFDLPEGWELSAGVMLYGYWFAESFRFQNAASPEIFAALTRTRLPFSPCLSVYCDLNLGSGLYVTLGGGQELKLGDRISMDVGGLIGFNSRQYIDGSGFSDIDLYARVPLAMGRLTLTPSLNVMIPLLDEVNEDVEFWVGLSAAIGGGG